MLLKLSETHSRQVVIVDMPSICFSCNEFNSILKQGDYILTTDIQAFYADVRHVVGQLRQGFGDP